MLKNRLIFFLLLIFLPAFAQVPAKSVSKDTAALFRQLDKSIERTQSLLDSLDILAATIHNKGDKPSTKPYFKTYTFTKVDGTTSKWIFCYQIEKNKYTGGQDTVFIKVLKRNSN